MNLTVNDLANMVALIDLASSRGTFRAHELKAVSELYEKLVQELKTETENKDKE